MIVLSIKAFDIAVKGIRERVRIKNLEAIFMLDDKEEKKKLINEYIAKLKSDYRNMK